MLSLMAHDDFDACSPSAIIPGVAQGRPASTGNERISDMEDLGNVPVTAFEPREDLFLEGDDAAHLVEVVEGVVCGYRLLPDGQRHVVSFYFPGDFLGYCCLGTHAFSAQAVSRVKVRRIQRSAVDRLVENRPDFARKLLRLAASELTATRDHLLCLASKSAEAKMASFLLALSRRNESVGENPTRVHLQMTRVDIGDYLGLTIETVSRTLSKFKRAGKIALPRTSIVEILQREELEEIAEH